MRPLLTGFLLTFLVGRSVGQGTPAPAKGLILGSQKNQPGEGMIQGLPGSQFALFLPNKQHKILGTIRSASFFIDPNGAPARQFRVHLCTRQTAPPAHPAPTCSPSASLSRLPRAANGSPST